MSSAGAAKGVAAEPLIDAHHGEDGGSRKKKFGGGAARYMECLKNHATAIGGSATDGCGEFLAGGEEGTIEALKCCACNCHRNYHRRIDVSLGVSAAAAEVLVRMEYDMEVRRRKAEEAAKLRKRFRTKFTQEQKEKMQQFAKKCGWKLMAGDAEVRSFCDEIGVEEKVLKVWMHNNKSTFADNTNTSNDNEYTNSPVAIY